MKKWIALLLAVCMLMALTACGASKSQSSSGTSSGNSGTVELTFWHSMDSVYADLLNRQVDAFNKGIGAQKGIHVTAVFQDYPGTEALTAAMTSDDVNNMPDVIQLYSESVSLIRNYKRTVWAEDYISASDAAVKKSDLIPNTVEAYSIGGKMIGVPYSVSALMLYYNKTYLQQAGYTEPPRTIAEMAAMLPALVDKTDAQYGLNVRVNLFELQNWINTQGASGTYFGNNDSGHAGYMTELNCQDQLKAYLTEWQKVVDSGAYKSVRDSINEEFAAGMHAMVIMSSSRIPTIEKLVGSSFDWDVAPIPTVSAGDVGGAYPSGSGLFMLDRGDQAKKDAAWQFVQYMISDEAQTMWLDGTGYVPVNVNAVNRDDYKSYIAKDPRLAAPFTVLDSTPKSVVDSFTPNSSDVDSTIKNAMLQMGSGSASADTTYDAITQGCAQAFADYYRANPIS